MDLQILANRIVNNENLIEFKIDRFNTKLKYRLLQAMEAKK